MKYLAGDSYEGEWKDGKKHGKGLYKSLDGYSYDGEWKNSKMDGQGVYKYPNGDFYRGEWKDNDRNGMGMYYDHSNGAKFEGQWLNDEENGQGIYESPLGLIYNGLYKDGKLNGKSVCNQIDKNIKIITTAEYKNDFVVKNDEIKIEYLQNKKIYNFKYLENDNIEFSTSTKENVLINQEFQENNPRLKMFLDFLGNGGFNPDEVEKLNKFSEKNKNNTQSFEYKNFEDSKSFLEFLQNNLKGKFIVDIPEHEIYIENGKIFDVNAEEEKNVIVSCFTDEQKNDLENFLYQKKEMLQNINLDKSLKIGNVEIPMSVLCCRHLSYALALISAQYGSLDKYLEGKKDLKVGLDKNSNIKFVRPSSPINVYKGKEEKIENNLIKEEDIHLSL
jgi:hypothetical protein